MNLLARFRSWLKWVVKGRKLETEMEVEVGFHIESYAADLMRKGLSQQEALRQARIEFGGIESHKDAMRASVGVRWWAELGSDLRYGARMLGKSPGFTAVAVCSLALGIGANTAIFSTTKTILLDSLSVPHPEQLRVLRWEFPGDQPMHSLSGDVEQTKAGATTSSSFSYPVYEALSQHGETFESLAAFENDIPEVVASVDGYAESVSVQLVSGDFFSTFQVTVAQGRALLPSDDVVAGGGSVGSDQRCLLGMAVCPISCSHRQDDRGESHPNNRGGCRPAEFYRTATRPWSRDVYAPKHAAHRRSVGLRRNQWEARGWRSLVVSSSWASQTARDGHTSARIARRRVRASSKNYADQQGSQRRRTFTPHDRARQSGTGKTS